MRRTAWSLVTIPLLLFGSRASLQAGTLIHDYELNGSYADFFGGPAMNPNGGTLGATGYTFTEGQGPNLSSAINPTNYAIQMGFFIGDTNGFKKLLDFKDRTSDTGLYNINGALTFYNIQTGPDTVFAPNQQVDLLLTRDGTTGQVLGYVNGVQEINFTDTGNLATFTGANNIIHFLRNDAFFNEDPRGFLDYVRIYDGPITPAQEASGPPSAVPEPASLTMLGIGAVGLIAYSWRRRKVAACASR